MKNNYKKIQNLIHAKGSVISDKKFLTSPLVEEELTGELQAMMRKYLPKKSNCRFPVHIFWDENDNAPTGYTDYRGCYINAAGKLLSSRGNRLGKWRILKGIGKHELGHKLYTNYKYKAAIIENIQKGVFLPAPALPWQGLEDMLKGGRHSRSFQWLYRQIENALEDGYIEYRLLEDFPHPNHRLDLEELRMVHYESIPSLKENIQNERSDTDILFSILNLLLGYAKYGYIKCSKAEMADERICIITKCIPYIDDVNNYWDAFGHYTAIANVCALLEPYILAYLDTCEEENMTEEEILHAMKSNTHGNLQADSDNTNPSASIPDSEGLVPQPDENDSHHFPKDPFEKPDALLPDIEDLCQENSIENGDILEDTTQTASAEAKKQMQSILNAMITQEAEEELEEIQKRDLAAFDQSINYGSIHKGVHAKINRQIQISNEQKQDYEEAAKEYLSISRLMNKKYVTEIKALAEEELIKGLYYGRQFHAPSISRLDKKYFATKHLPDTPSMSVGLVIDQSGSMLGKRITMARIMAVIVEDFCRSLNIRCSIIGHSVSSTVELDIYASFGSVDQNDRYRLMNISSGGCNRDGYALKYMEESLKKESSDIKLLFMVSDGQPNDDNYQGATAYDDLRHLKTDCKRNGILLIAAAIGDDKDIIKAIYGDGFLNISDLNQLPAEIINLIKKHLPGN